MDSTDLRRHFELSLALHCSADPESGRFLDLNDAWVDVLGWSPQELRSRPWIEFVHPDDVEATLAVASTMKSGVSVVDFDNRYRHRDGYWVWLSWVGRLEDGVFYGSARDITSYRVLMTELEQTRRELSQVAFASAHDLREPLRTIHSQLTVHEQTESPEALAHCHEAVERMATMLDGLLELLDVDRRCASRVPVDLSSVVSDVVSRLGRRLDAAGAQVHVEALPIVFGDATQLESLFENLLCNALKFRSEDRPLAVEIGVQALGERAVVTVVDNGSGFPQARADRALQLFQRLHPRDRSKGAGVGLALCQRIAADHGGSIRLKSQEGAGTTVFVELQCA